MARTFTPEWREKLSIAAKKRVAEGRNPALKRGGAHQVGAKNPRWKNNQPGYRPQFPKTGTCERCGQRPAPISYLRKGKVVQRVMTAWANLSGEYRRSDRSDWQELCKSCQAQVNGIASNFGDQRRPSGPEHPQWKGDDASYGSKHALVKRQFTKTGACEECGVRPQPITYLRQGRPVTRRTTDWANISGEYRRLDRSDWRELCRSCHAKMDNFAKNLPM